jgi:hypothetical protein
MSVDSQGRFLFLARPPRLEPPALPVGPGELVGESARCTRPLRALLRERPKDAAPPSESTRQPSPRLRRFAERTLTMVLEVLDGKRVTAALATMMDEKPLNVVRETSRKRSVPVQGGESARLHKVRIQHAEGCSAAEVTATYRRGPRTFALAARIVTLPNLGPRITDIQLMPG